MNHVTEDQFVLLYYGETPESRGIEEHLSQCEQCRDEFRTLQLVLNTVDSAPVPERDSDYGSAVWQRLAGRLVTPQPRRAFRWWMWAPLTAALVMAAFLAGRISHRPEAPAISANRSSEQVRERILLVAIGDHLDRSQMVLAELSNAPPGKGKLDISAEREMAEELLPDNRLYRETARSTGDVAVASVLDDLERVLMEIAHSPGDISQAELASLRQQIESRGVLFEVRILGARVRDEESKPAGEKDKNHKKL